MQLINWLDFIQGVINRRYLLLESEDPTKSPYYNMGLRYAAFRDVDEVFKLIRKIQTKEDTK